MPLDNPLFDAESSAGEPAFIEPTFVEPRLPAADSDDWQGILRQIFETEGGIWHRRAIAPRASRFPL